jgi:hypothetical protein
MLQKIFARYTGFLRNLKAVYVINNWLQRRRLRHNKALYQQFGVKKSIFAPIGHRDFEGHATTADHGLTSQMPLHKFRNALDLQIFHLNYKTKSDSLSERVTWYWRVGSLPMNYRH